MTPEEQLLLQQQQKLEGIEQQQRYNLFRSPGQVQGETPQQFAAGKQAANSQAQGYGANPAPVSQPPVQSVAHPVVQQTPARKTQGTVQNKPAITNMDELAAAIGYTSPEQEEKLRKASVANQRILALGDALRHIGNIATTINYAPSQQFNNPVQEEYARYERGKALRDKANQTYLTYQQAKAAQDAKQRQWEMQFRYNAAKDAATAQALREYRNAGLKEKGRQFDAGLAYRAKNDEANRKQRGEHQKEMERQGRQRIGIASQNSKNAQAYRQWKMNNGGSGGKGGTPYRYAAPYGGTIELPKGLNATQIDQIVTNKDFQKYRNRSALQEAMIMAGVNTNDPAQVRRYEAAKMMQEHPEVAEFVAKRFGGSVTGMQQPPLVSQQSGMNGWVAPGNAWSQPGGNYNWDNYLDSGIGATPVNDDDDEEEEENWDEFLVD